MQKNRIMIENITITPEHKVLAVLYLLSYLMAMFIQIKDKKVKVVWSDWFIGFFTSLIGATLTYFAVASWANLGLRMTMTIIVSLVSYRTFKFILSPETQEKFASGIGNGLLEVLKNFINSKENRK